jgi:CRP-like cAMP-binding protein
MIASAIDFNERFSFITNYIKPNEIDLFLEYVQVSQIDAGDVITRDGEPSSTLYFVKSGTLLTYIEEKGEVIEIGEIKPGEYIGEISFFDEGLATAYVKALEPCTLFTLSRNDFTKLEKEHPHISSNLMRSISNLIISRTLVTSSLLFDGLSMHEDENTNKEESANLSDWLVALYGSLHKH